MWIGILGGSFVYFFVNLLGLFLFFYYILTSQLNNCVWKIS